MPNPQDELAALRAQVASLTGRIYRLEQHTGIEATEPSPQLESSPAAPAPLPSPPSVPTTPQLLPLVAGPSRDFGMTADNDKEEERDELENKIGTLWLNRIGIVATLIGVSYFVKYAFDNGWIGPSGRVALGLLAGIGLVLWSERFRNREFAAFSYSLKAVGIGTLYLSLWGAFQVYHLVPSAVAFVAMIAVTAATMVLAIRQDAEILAAFAMIGGFSTPVLLSSGENHEIVLFSYVFLLDIAILAMVTLKPWRRLIIGSFIGTCFLYIGWFSEYYTQEQRLTTVLFAILFSAIFAAVPLLTPLTKSRWHAGISITLTALPLVNAAALFLALFVMYESEKTTLTWYSLVLAASYLALSSQFKRRVGSEPGMVHTVNLIHVAIAIAFITIAIPLKLNSHWITIGWLVESAALLYVAVRTQTDFLRYFAVATLGLGIARLLFFDNFNVETLVFNARFATYLVAIAILAGIVAAGFRFASEQEMPFVRVAGVLLNVLALIAMTLEAADYFGRQLAEWWQSRAAVAQHATQQLQFERNFSYSAIWLAYGAGLMMFGFWKRSAFVRWQALVLIAFTVGKVFLYDVSALQQGYRIVSFIALGGVLMAVSYVYHRDWLKLSSRSASDASRRNSA
jgi:uncharacterized membrane protein